MSELKVKGSGKRIKVQNVFCIGRNYEEHVKEMTAPGSKAEISEEPVIFLKPNSAVISGHCNVSIPQFKGRNISENLQNEVELVIVIGKDGRNIPPNKALKHVYGYAVGIDFTLRDLQSVQKSKGLPWTVSKGFFGAAPISKIARRKKVPDANGLNISLSINDEIKQSANTSEMIFKIDYIIHYVSSIFGLKMGDLIFTGTPSGVTKLNPGDIVIAEIESIGKLKVKIK